MSQENIVLNAQAAIQFSVSVGIVNIYDEKVLIVIKALLYLQAEIVSRESELCSGAEDHQVDPQIANLCAVSTRVI